NRDVMDEVFELRGQNHVHEHHGQAEGDEEVLPGFLQRLGATGEDDAVAGREVERPNVFAHVLDRFAKGFVHQVGYDGDLALALEAIDLVRAPRFAEAHEVRQLNEAAVVGGP